MMIVAVLQHDPYRGLTKSPAESRSSVVGLQV